MTELEFEAREFVPEFILLKNIYRTMLPLHFVQSQTFLKAQFIFTSSQSVYPVQCTSPASIPIALFYFIYLLFKELSLSLLINWFICISYVYQFMCTFCPWRFELHVSCSVNVRYCWVKNAYLTISLYTGKVQHKFPNYKLRSRRVKVYILFTYLWIYETENQS